ncbi:type VI secretion system-associated protein TagF [Rhizobium sp. CNPSo 3464]|uniref:type VI secretion system-associated protein TagF n=1 Tax=Rhizobium sp. CNPSo 3464 TaxID=3021406 RepID=UPI00254CA252|nr:type VI secretion system-associated protein TagF [Rhizobium sp. CNPSo 3464]MDK4741187.1 type VI secretion system-associated protein TagF [Rhizobium sp. CNPSo 3464]
MNERSARTALPQETDMIGFFGKLPTHGDFVSTALGRRFQIELDRWIQDGLGAMEPTLGKDWRRLFHACPPWRFAIAGGVWSPAAVAGVLLPSKDRVGRSFPLIIAAQLHRFTGRLRDICEDDIWFTAAEALAETSTKSDFDMPRFIEGVRRLRLPIPNIRPTDDAVSPDIGAPASLWWRMVPDTRHGKGFKTEGPPTIRDFLKLVTVEEPRGPPPAVASQSTEPADNVTAPETGRRIESSYASHSGTRLSLNADALLVSERPRLFALADGVGDSTGAIEAARTATSVLASVAAQESLQALVQDIKGKLGHANSILQTKAASGEQQPPFASIVVAAIFDGKLALIWAGDARCYLLRDGMMRCLTRDHVDIGLRRTLARGVGLKQQFVPDTFLDALRPGDRLILCSAALSRMLADRVIAEIMIETPIERAANALVQEGLIANCRENLSAIVVGVP